MYQRANLIKTMVGCTLATSLYTYHRQPTFNFCQGGNPIPSRFENRVSSLNHMGIVKHLMSVLRDKTTDTKTFRAYSDRIMRLLVEEAIA